MLNSITRRDYKQFIQMNDRITSGKRIYRIILQSFLNTLHATGDMKAAVVSRIGGMWEVREVPMPQPSAAE
jgi:hypothetical protein